MEAAEPVTHTASEFFELLVVCCQYPKIATKLAQHCTIVVSVIMAYNSYVGSQQQRLRKAREAVSKLHSALGDKNEFELPGIVVVGQQSVGKSSLLEAISGIRLPSGSGLCTMCPLQLEMHEQASTSYTLSYDHQGSEQSVEITKESKISEEIEKATEVLTGGIKQIVSSVITLKVCKPDAPNLTLLDLPGVQGSTPAGFPDDTKTVIENLVMTNCQGQTCGKKKARSI